MTPPLVVDRCSDDSSDRNDAKEDSERDDGDGGQGEASLRYAGQSLATRRVMVVVPLLPGQDDLGDAEPFLAGAVTVGADPVRAVKAVRLLVSRIALLLDRSLFWSCI